MPYLSFPEFTHRMRLSHVPHPVAVWQDKTTHTLYAEYVEPLTTEAFQHVSAILNIDTSRIQNLTSSKTTLIIKNPP